MKITYGIWKHNRVLVSAITFERMYKTVWSQHLLTIKILGYIKEEMYEENEEDNDIFAAK